MTVTRPARMFAVAAAVLALAAGVTACGGGGGGDDKTKVEDRVNTLYDSFASKDEKGICSSLSDKQKKEITKSGNRGGKKQSCEEIMKFALAFLGDQLKDAKNAKVTDVKIDGEKATATVEYKGKKGRLGLAEDGGDWLIDDFNLRKI